MPTASNDPPASALYGARVAFKQDCPIQFEDFLLTFVGERRVTTPLYARGFRFFDFLVLGPAGTLSISWTAGTGDICPALFTVAGRDFSLELGISSQFGVLHSNECVLSRIHGTA